MNGRILRKLKAQFVVKNVSHEEAAHALSMSSRSLYRRIRGEVKFTFPETVILRDTFFPDCSLEELFLPAGTIKPKTG